MPFNKSLQFKIETDSSIKTVPNRLFTSTYGTTKASAGSNIAFETIHQNKKSRVSDKGLYNQSLFNSSETKIRDKTLLDEHVVSSDNMCDEENRQISELQFLTEYRSMKTACHELCHVFGMTHCPYFECLMNGSNLVNEADQKPFLLCPICLRKLEIYLVLKDKIP